MIQNISVENHHANFIPGGEVLILCFSIKANAAMLLGWEVSEIWLFILIGVHLEDYSL